MKHKFCALYGNTGIRPLHKNDIEKVRQWRNDRELSKYLSPMNEISRENQEEWFSQYCEDRNCIFFAVTDIEKRKCIGTVAIYDFKDNTAEAGKIVIGDTSERGKGNGYLSLLMAMSVGFTKLGVEKYKLRVCEENLAAYSIYRKTGFRETGRHPFFYGMTEIDMEITRAEFITVNTTAKEIILFTEDSRNSWYKQWKQWQD